MANALDIASNIRINEFIKSISTTIAFKTTNAYVTPVEFKYTPHKNKNNISTSSNQ